MAFLVKVPQAVVSVISQLFEGEPSGIQTGIDSVSHRFCFEPLFLDLRNVKEILRMIARNDLL